MNRLPEAFEKAMDDDFNTASALGIIQRTTRELNRLLAEVKKDGRKGLPSSLLQKGVKTFTTVGNVLGILTIDPIDYFKQKQEAGMQDVALSEEEIRKYIEERKEARAKRIGSVPMKSGTSLLTKVSSWKILHREQPGR